MLTAERNESYGPAMHKENKPDWQMGKTCAARKNKNISSSRITLEITERDSIEGMGNFIYNIRVLRTLGFRVAVDDTGAGYASYIP